MSRAKISAPFRASGPDSSSSFCARPSTIAVLPTPGSPTKTGLFLRRRQSTSSARPISRTRPITGSSLPSRARSVRLEAKAASGSREGPASSSPSPAGAPPASPSPGLSRGGPLRAPCEMKLRMSSRVTPWAPRSSTAWERASRMSAASMSPTPASSLPALWTWTTAVCSTRRKASVCCGGRREPGGSFCIVCSRNSASSWRRRGTSAPAASRISSPSGSWAAANRRCSTVRSACRLTMASRAATLSTRSRDALNTVRPPRSPRGGETPRCGPSREPSRPSSPPPRTCTPRTPPGPACAPPS